MSGSVCMTTWRTRYRNSIQSFWRGRSIGTFISKVATSFLSLKYQNEDKAEPPTCCNPEHHDPEPPKEDVPPPPPEPPGGDGGPPPQENVPPPPPEPPVEDVNRGGGGGVGVVSGNVPDKVRF